MASLVEKGEIRVYVVGGKVMYSIHTWPSERFQQAMQFEVVENYTPLELVE